MKSQVLVLISLFVVAQPLPAEAGLLRFLKKVTIAPFYGVGVIVGAVAQALYDGGDTGNKIVGERPGQPW